MNTHVIILAQGQQTRLRPIVTVPKQLVHLPAHEAAGIRTTILGRTLAMVFRYLNGVGINLEPGPTQEQYNDHRVTVVGWPSIRDYFNRHPVRIHYQRDGRSIGFQFIPEVDTLADPGNSSLVGLARFLELATVIRTAEWPDRTVVLLGDVCYSWACLRTCFRGDTNLVPTRNFVRSPVLNEQGGEIWGAMWRRDGEEAMLAALREAQRKCASVESDEYQPGQLRHWYWATDMRHSIIDDYTMDLDTPEQLVQLTESSLQAFADDREQGVL